MRLYWSRMAHQYEIEIKSLLGEKAGADALVKRMCEIDPSVSCVAKNTQRNHYFVGDDFGAVVNALAPLFSGKARCRLDDIAASASEFSVRTREKNGEVLFVVKASVDDTTSLNGISRIEFEEPVGLSLDELDRRIIDAGFSYQAKWSREREEYVFRGTNVCLDKNAGYGYLAEFERVVSDVSVLEQTRDDIMAVMAELGVEELPQERLARMFSHYNEHWDEYYGTDKTFTVA